MQVVKPFRPLSGLREWMRVLDEMNKLGQQHENIIRDSVPKVTVY